jgi:hypothetical protein
MGELNAIVVVENRPTKGLRLHAANIGATEECIRRAVDVAFGRVDQHGRANAIQLADVLPAVIFLIFAAPGELDVGAIPLSVNYTLIQGRVRDGRFAGGVTRCCKINFLPIVERLVGGAPEFEERAGGIESAALHDLSKPGGRIEIGVVRCLAANLELNRVTVDVLTDTHVGAANSR